MDAPLEVLDPGAPGVDMPLLRMIAALPDRGAALVLGSPEDADRVRGVGLDVAGRVSLPRSAPRTRTRTLARHLEAFDSDVPLRSWSEPTLAALLPLATGGRRLDAVVAAVGSAPPWVEPWHRRRVAVRPIGLDLGPRLARRGWRVGGVLRAARMPIDRLDGGGLPPPVRRDDAFVVAVPVEPVDAMDPWTLVAAVATAAVSGRSVVLMVPRSGTAWPEIGRWACGMVPASAGTGLRVVVDDRVGDPGALAGGVDAVVIPVRAERAGDTSLVTVRAWLSTGVPVIGPATRGVGELVEDGVDGRLVAPGDRNALARAILRLADDSALREDMAHAAAARHGGRRSFAGSRRPWTQGDGSAAANASAASR